jgi:hypothetical protein
MVCAAGVGLTPDLAGQAPAYERSFPQSKAAVESALSAMQANLSGRLPVLEGFAAAAQHPLDQYRRGFYQADIQVIAAPSGGSIVRITAKVTAWYNDPAPSHSGYQLLPSNGRLESDLLDQLSDQLAAGSSAPVVAKVSPSTSNPPQREVASNAVVATKPAMPQPTQTAVTPPPPSATETAHPAAATIARPVPSNTAAATIPVPSSVSAPSATTSDNKNTFSSTLNRGMAAEEHASASSLGSAVPGKADSELQTEAASLEEILKNQAHPRNLVAIKKSGTAVVASPSLKEKPLFLADMHDEFELLDFNRDWVHVRISGLSRGWIWRDSVEMPDGIPDSEAQSKTPAPPTASDAFRVEREETAAFPGDWEPLRGKSVKIFSVQKVDDNSPDPGPALRLEYAKFLLDKNYAALTQKSQDLAGIVLIFDSADGGMIAATTATLQQWKAGSLSDAALWHRCFFDPPETFDASAPAGSQ